MRNSYAEDFEEMKIYRASQFRSELHDIVMDVLDDVDVVRYQIQDEPDVVVMDAMESVNRDSLTEVEEALRHYDEPSELINRAEAKYAKAMKNLAYGSAVLLFSGIGIIAVNNGDLRNALIIIPGILWLLFLIDGIQGWKSAWKAERDVDKIIRDYKDNY